MTALPPLYVAVHLNPILEASVMAGTLSKSVGELGYAAAITEISDEMAL